MQHIPPMIYFVNDQDKLPVTYKLKMLTRRAVETVLEHEQYNNPCEVSITYTDNEQIHALNLQYRQVDRPTDVLSFPVFDLLPGEHPDEEDADPGTGLIPLGDMVISMERCEAQAAEYGHSKKREIAYLVTHSVLHLLGYDHLDEGEEKKRMRAREEAILSELGITRE